MRRFQCAGYSVLLASGSLALAGTHGAPPRSFFYKRAEAVKFRNDLVAHELPKGKVVKVKVVYEWEE